MYVGEMKVNVDMLRKEFEISFDDGEPVIYDIENYRFKRKLYKLTAKWKNITIGGTVISGFTNSVQDTSVAMKEMTKTISDSINAEILKELTNSAKVIK